MLSELSILEWINSEYPTNGMQDHLEEKEHQKKLFIFVSIP